MSASIGVGRLGLTSPSSYQTIVNLSYSGKSDTDVLYTVPAGKTLFVIGLQVINDAASAVTAGIHAGAQSIEFYVNTIGTSVLMGTAVLMTQTAGNTVTMRWTGVAAHGAGTFWGWLE